MSQQEHANLPEPMGESDEFLEFQTRLSSAARIDRPVLLIGERGTGKELAASRLHFLSGRWDSPFVALNCAALSPSLIETELFGHESGAFTGATSRRLGRFEAADRGTLFLDEIGLIPIEVQEKILRVVEYGAFERVGGSKPITIDVRIIAATNADLPALTETDAFKRDLLDRLSFEVLFLPPLRLRRGDVALLARHFAARMAFEIGRDEVPAFSETCLAELEGYDWPGNVRELKNVVERAVYRCDGEEIDRIETNPFIPPFPCRLEKPRRRHFAEDRDREVEPASTDTGSPNGDPELVALTPFRMGLESLPDRIRDFELEALRNSLERARYRQADAADLLGISYHQFRALYRKHRESFDD